MFCRNRVADFEAWKAVFDSHADAHRTAGLKLIRFWRSIDDPNEVFFLFDVESLEKAQQFTAPRRRRKPAGRPVSWKASAAFSSRSEDTDCPISAAT